MLLLMPQAEDESLRMRITCCRPLNERRMW